MKIICAPDSFKESITAAAAAEAMARGIRNVIPDATIDLCPIADGGEGTVDALVAATGGTMRTTTVFGPLGQHVSAQWGLLGLGDGSQPTAVIEMAAASGLALVEPAKRDPLRTTTFGTGELIQAALDAGARRIIVGIGGSATNDGGCGMAQAVGVKFVNWDGDACVCGLAGGGLKTIARIDLAKRDQRLADTEILVACDVTNPLTGPQGAAAIYGPQKGATPAMVEQLDRGLKHLAELWRTQLGFDIEHLPGFGAAGGLGGGLVAFLDATLRPGVELVLDAVEFDTRVKDCDLCLTGEGKLDGQSLSGKACMGVAHAAGRHQVKTIALVGSLGPGAQRTLDAGLAGYHCISEGLSADESMRRAGQLLHQTAATVVRGF